MKKLLLSLVLVSFALSQNTVAADTASNTPDLNLVQKIDEARKLLEPVKLNYSISPQYKTVTKTVKKKKTTTKVLSGYKLDAKDLALAILDPATNQIRITAAIQRDTSFEFPDKNFAITKIRFNGVNTRFSVQTPANGKVVALKYLISPVETGSKAAIENALYDGIYTPYSPELLDDGVSQAGNTYLSSVITAATTALQNKNSVSVPGKSIPEAIKPELVRALLYAEHMDTTEFLNTTDTEQLIKKVNILLGSNKGETWKYSVSSAGAAGISQFIPSTYASLVKRHPDAQLIPNFVTGMRDHTNAVKATFILLDDYIKAVQDRAPEYFLSGHAFDYGVAAYNGGPARVANAARQFGTAWYEDNSDKLSPLNGKIALQNTVVNSLKTKLKKTTGKTQKAAVQKTLSAEQATLNSLTAERDSLDRAILRNETVNYVLKIHRLVQVFNSNPLNVASK